MIEIKDGKKGSDEMLGYCSCWCMEGALRANAYWVGAETGVCGCGCGPTTSDFSNTMGYLPPPSSGT